jgi:hypothetical protein
LPRPQPADGGIGRAEIDTAGAGVRGVGHGWAGLAGRRC